MLADRKAAGTPDSRGGGEDVEAEAALEVEAEVGAAAWDRGVPGTREAREECGINAAGAHS